MKETIYTIPLSESFEKESECPFCYLENKIEQEQIDYALGPAMMEPDHRILSNQKGYCRRHTAQLAEAKQALPFSLVLDTRMDEVIAQLEAARTGAKNKGLFSKRPSSADLVAQTANRLVSSCLVCDKIAHTMAKFMETFWYLYAKEPDFRTRVQQSKGFCLHHFKDLLALSDKHTGAKREAFCSDLVDLELSNLKRNKQDIHGFVKQFDYRSDKENWSVPKDAHLICAGKLSKF